MMYFSRNLVQLCLCLVFSHASIVANPCFEPKPSKGIHLLFEQSPFETFSLNELLLKRWAKMTIQWRNKDHHRVQTHVGIKRNDTFSVNHYAFFTGRFSSSCGNFNLNLRVLNSEFTCHVHLVYSKDGIAIVSYKSNTTCHMDQVYVEPNPFAVAETIGNQSDFLWSSEDQQAFTRAVEIVKQRGFLDYMYLDYHLVFNPHEASLLETRRDLFHFMVNEYFAQYLVFPGVQLVLNRIATSKNNNTHDFFGRIPTRSFAAYKDVPAVEANMLVYDFLLWIHARHNVTPLAHLHIYANTRPLYRTSVVDHAESHTAVEQPEEKHDLVDGVGTFGTSLAGYAPNHGGFIVFSTARFSTASSSKWHAMRRLVPEMVQFILQSLGAKVTRDVPPNSEVVREPAGAPLEFLPIPYRTQLELLKTYRMHWRKCQDQATPHFCDFLELFPTAMG